MALAVELEMTVLITILLQIPKRKRQKEMKRKQKRGEGEREIENKRKIVANQKLTLLKVDDNNLSPKGNKLKKAITMTFEQVKKCLEVLGS